MTICHLALGSNSGDTARSLRQAVEMLSSVGNVQRLSSIYLTPAWGVLEQPDFLNMALLVDFAGTAQELLFETQRIERAIGRKKTMKWGPRQIDIDLITFGGENLCSPELIIPHPWYLHRAFVLAPLAEIDSAFSASLIKLPLEEQKSAQIQPFGLQDLVRG